MESLKTMIVVVLAAATAALAVLYRQQSAEIWILREDVKNMRKTK